MQTHSIMFVFPYPVIIKHCLEQKCPVFLFKSVLSLPCVIIAVLNYSVVKIIAAARFENTQPVHSANVENGMETGLNILFSQISNKIFEYIFQSILRIIKQCTIAFTFYFPPKNISKRKCHLKKKTTEIIYKVFYEMIDN